MRSTNPVLTNLSEGQQQAAYGYDQVPPQYLDQSPQQADRPMTIDDVVTKTGMTLGVIIVFAALNFGLALMGQPSLALILTMVGGIGGFITVLVQSFGRKYGAATTLIYAAFEGLFVGGISLLFTGMTFGGGTNAGAMIGQAVLGTIGVFLGMLFVYKTGAIRVTPRFTRIVTGAIIGVAVMALGNLLLFLFTGANPLRDGGMLAIGFSLLCIVLAALSFLNDFDLADKMIRSGAPSKMSWAVALGLAVTLVWLYTEILRLLSYFNRN